MAKIREANTPAEVMAVVRQMEQEHPEIGRFTQEN
jgi:hypothetical protein